MTLTVRYTKRIICEICGKNKYLKSYTLPTQREQKVCNTCKDKKYYGGGYASQGAPKYNYKIVKCLKCEEDFKGGVNIRVCGRCKGTKEYLEAVGGLNL